MTPRASSSWAELAGGADVGIVGPELVAEHAGVVDEQRVVRAGLDAADVVDPAGVVELVVVARCRRR